jgi:exopolyphosphatase/guanosine-5'-triphosphate,3'-diphosphate pyrophosphatase
MGCVAFTEQYINPAAVPSAGFLLAKEAAVHALKEGIEADGTTDELRREPQLVVGTSGTIESVQTVLAANGWPSDVITAEAIDDLGQSIAADRWVIDAGLPGLAPDRMDIFAAGVAILSACFEVLQIQTLRFAPVSMLQGMIGAAVVEDLTQDLCEDSVERLAERYGVDRPQALRVMDSATELFAKTAAWWEPDDLPLRQLLRWAARLHEVGVVVSSSHYHRHGGYIIKHSQMPGFTHPQQNILALLVRGHRRSMPGLAFRAFDPDLADKLLRLVALLRIAVILQRSHCDGDAPTSLSLTANQNTLHLRCGADWLATHPLSHKELQVEAGQLHRVGLNLVFGD